MYLYTGQVSKDKPVSSIKYIAFYGSYTVYGFCTKSLHDHTHMIPRLSRFLVCNIEKLGGAWASIVSRAWKLNDWSEGQKQIKRHSDWIEHLRMPVVDPITPTNL